MAHLPVATLEARFMNTCEYIIQEWQQLVQRLMYALQCSCEQDCYCMRLEDVPRIVIDKCLYIGELDRFYVEQPFCEQYGFSVIWHYDICEEEMECGFPPLGVPQVLEG